MKGFYVAMHPVDPVEISAYRDGDLDESRRRIVERHVEACAGCREQLFAYELVGSELQARADVAAPPSLDRRVAALIVSQGERRRWSPWPRWIQQPVGIVAVLALVLAAALLNGLPFAGNQEGPLVAAAYLYSDQGEPAIEVHFSAPVNRDEVARTLHIEPAVELNVGWRGDTMVVKPVEPIHPAREYTLSLKPSGPESSATPVALRFAGDTPSTPVPLVTPPVAAIAHSATPSATATAIASATPRSTQSATASPVAGQTLPGTPQAGGTPTASPSTTPATPGATAASTAVASPPEGTPGTAVPTAPTSTTPTAATTTPGAATPGTATPTTATPTMAAGETPAANPTTGIATPSETATPPAGSTVATTTPAPTMEGPPATPSTATEEPQPTRTPMPRATATPMHTALPTAAPAATTPPFPAFGRAYETASAQSPSAAARLGVPSTEERRVAISHQDFQLGAMLWRADTREILVIYDDGAWTIHRDTWHERERLTYSGPIPPGVTVPSKRFGKLWSSVPEVRLTLGWATDGEQSLVGAVQDFAGGQLLMEGGRLIYAFYPDGSWDSFIPGRVTPPVDPPAEPDLPGSTS